MKNTFKIAILIFIIIYIYIELTKLLKNIAFSSIYDKKKLYKKYINLN